MILSIIKTHFRRVQLVRNLLLPAVLLTHAATVQAEDSHRRATVVVAAKAKVTGAKITLGDIAVIKEGQPEFSKLADKLRGLYLVDSPPPSGTARIVGESILAKIQEEGIDIDTFGYSIPAVVDVERKGRVITTEEVLQAVRSKLQENKNLDLQVREVNWRSSHVIPDEKAELKVESLGTPSAGNLPIRVEAIIGNETVARFLATAVVDDWREVPVLNRPIERGQLISPADVQSVRLNLYKQASDIVDSVKDVYGRRAKAGMAAGETIRRSQIDLPPVVAKGQKVSMVFQSGLLHATATGIAMEDGQKNEIINVRNEQSKKIVEATIVSESEVKVEGQ